MNTAAPLPTATFAVLTRKFDGADAPWEVTSTHATIDEAWTAQETAKQMVVRFAKGERVHGMGNWTRV